ncbi:SAYSvFN domain-containing protein 1 isoform X2 [Hyla sarda]|nr:SAYSvFN domain-containing protein 1 isoform X2 [Hyla sarda]XP_056424621.1 SAYSvFN domain-containing protein 1 isoform X2 [Hyla sarda]XP_056424622.1 SAYSvFN domain-containing protein 1 isoform X2 [Hyla sarda]
MEQRLAEFRARKAKIHPQPDESGHKVGETEQRRNTFIKMAKEKFHSVCSKWKTLGPAETPLSDARTEVLQTMPVTSEEAAHYDVEPTSSSSWKNVLLLKFLLWLVLLGLFVELEFGLAYFLLSMFYWMYEGTRRSGLRKKGEKSAYSVFNPGCEAIQGTITAEQFERELQYSPLAGI